MIDLVKVSLYILNFQLSYWGRVEWAHELSQQDLQTRLSAAVLFIHFNSSSTLIKSKSVT